MVYLINVCAMFKEENSLLAEQQETMYAGSVIAKKTEVLFVAIMC